MKTRTHFTHRIDMWDDAGENIVEHLAGVEDFDVAVATYRAAAARWPGSHITLRAGARVVHETGQEAPDDGPDGIDRHTPLGFYNFAASYHAAADLIAEQGLKATHPEAPPTFLYYHAIELYLKSVLRLHGTSAGRLQKIGHDFRALRSRAEKYDLDLADDESDVLELMAAGDLWSRARYLKTGPLRMPTATGLRKTARTLRGWAAEALKAAGQPVRMPPHRKAE